MGKRGGGGGGTVSLFRYGIQPVGGGGAAGLLFLPPEFDNFSHCSAVPVLFCRSLTVIGEWVYCDRGETDPTH